MIPTPEEVDELRELIGHVNELLITPDTTVLQQHKNRISLEREGKATPSERVRTMLADLYRQQGWQAETFTGVETSNACIQLNHPASTTPLHQDAP